MEGRIGFGQRFGAYLIDLVVILVGGAILGFVLGGVIGAGTGAAVGADGDVEGSSAAGGALGGIMGAIIGMAVGIGLMSLIWVIWEGLTGAALGKMLLKIRIKSADGATAPTGQLMGRAAAKYSGSLLGLLAALTGVAMLSTLGLLLSFAVFVGCFFTLGQAKQAFHDMIAKTAVYPNQ